jgi:hypothetical protein
MAGLGGLLLLVATAATLREPPPEPTPLPEPVAAQPVSLAPVPPVPQAGTGRIQSLFPSYPKARVVPMGQLEANGNPMEMAYFETPDSMGEVLDFYAREFRRRGHRVVQQPDGAGGGAVNYYDPQRGALVSVTAMAVGSAAQPRTMVFPSIVEAPEGIHLQGSAPASLPRPPGAMTVLRVDDVNPGSSGGSTTLTEVAHGTPRVLAGFYREQFAARGYTQVESRSGKDGVELLDFRGDGERLTISVSPVAKDGQPESLVTVVLERTRPLQEATP